MLRSFFSPVLGLQGHSVKPEYLGGVLKGPLSLWRFLIQFFENSGSLTSSKLAAAAENIPSSVLSWPYTIVAGDPRVIECMRNKDLHFILRALETLTGVATVRECFLRS